jgi:hypothetical protein
LLRVVFFDEYFCKVANLKLDFVESVICCEVVKCCRVILFFKAMLNVVDFKVANVMLDFLKVALRVDSVKVAKFINEDLRSGRLIFCVIC